MQTLLTLVIPVYNVVDYLDECLDSLKSLDASIILVDDGSTDNSGEICDRFAESNPSVKVFHKRNGGLSDARNFGTRFVDTEYLFYLDSDDWVDAYALTDALNFAIGNDLDWVQCGYAYYYENGSRYNAILEKTGILNKPDIFERLIKGSLQNFAWGKIYRTEMVRNFSFPVGKYYEDSFWQYKVIENCRSFGIFPAITTFYRQRSGSISNRPSLKNLDLIEGTERRLNFMMDRYPDLAPGAAVRLWKYVYNLSRDRHITGDTAGIFNEKEFEIREHYGDLITEGICQFQRRDRVLLNTAFKGQHAIHSFFDITCRLTARIQRSFLK